MSCAGLSRAQILIISSFVVAKISTVSSANIFTNRELESLSRALSLRRLTYTIFTGEQNRFLTQLPVIQEKLVDLLRSSVGDMVHAEVSGCQVISIDPQIT